MTWQRAKALEGRRVRVRFTVEHLGFLVGPVLRPKIVEVLVKGPEGECRSVALLQYDLALLNGGTQLSAEGVLRVRWDSARGGGTGYIAVVLENARLVK